jgi:hypothetical protein
LSACIPHFVAQSLELAYRHCNTQAAFGEHRGHKAFMCRLVITPGMKSSSPELALRSLPALETIGSDSDLVAQAT